jgi:hypothetical protein
MRRRALHFVLLAGCAAPAWPCHDPANVNNNCGFTADITTGGWASTNGSCTHVASPSSSETGAASCAAGATFTFPGGPVIWVVNFRQCTDNASPGTYGYGFDAQWVSGSPVPCSISLIQTYDQDGCGGNPTGFGTGSDVTPVTGTYTQSPATTFVAGPNTTSLLIRLSCSSSAPFTVLFDDVFAGVNLEPVELQSFAVE